MHDTKVGSRITRDGIAGRIRVATPLALFCPVSFLGVAMAGSAPPGPSAPNLEATAGIAVFSFGFPPSGFLPMGGPHCSANARQCTYLTSKRAKIHHATTLMKMDRKRDSCVTSSRQIIGTPRQCSYATFELQLTVVGRRANWLATQTCQDFPQLLFPRATQINDMSAALAAQGAAPAMLLLLLLLWVTFSCQPLRLSDHFCRQTDISPPECPVVPLPHGNHKILARLGIALSHGWASPCLMAHDIMARLCIL